jgi:hypothetical protein
LERDREVGEHVSQLSVLMKKQLRQTTYTEERVSEVSIYAYIAPSLWVCGKAESTWWKKLLTSWWPGYKEREEGLGSQYPLLELPPSDQTSFH